MCIRFQVKSRTQKQAKMFRNVRRTCWKYLNELESKLNERILPPVPSSKEDLDVLANKVHSTTSNSCEPAYSIESRFERKKTSGEIHK